MSICSVLQCVVVCCDMLQSVAVCSLSARAVSHVMSIYIVLRYVAVCCGVLRPFYYVGCNNGSGGDFFSKVERLVGK